MLKNNLDISEEFADSAAQRLLVCKNPVYLQAIIQHMKTGQEVFLANNRYNTKSLMYDFGMDYLNAILMLVWIDNAPDEALSALDDGIDDIV